MFTFRSGSLEAEKSEMEDTEEHLSVEVDPKARKSPSEPISTMCSSMKRQIISRAFYGWLAHCRHMKTVRKHLGGLTFHKKPVSVEDLSWHQGVTETWWQQIDWTSVQENQEQADALEEEIHVRTYLAGISASIRSQVWPYLLGYYKWANTTEEKENIDKKHKNQYENKLSDWMIIEAIVRQKDKETTAANIAKLSGKSDPLLVYVYK